MMQIISSHSDFYFLVAEVFLAGHRAYPPTTLGGPFVLHGVAFVTSTASAALVQQVPTHWGLTACAFEGFYTDWHSPGQFVQIARPWFICHAICIEDIGNNPHARAFDVPIALIGNVPRKENPAAQFKLTRSTWNVSLRQTSYACN
jgi:hypothetical protein